MRVKYRAFCDTGISGFSLITYRQFYSRDFVVVPTSELLKIDPKEGNVERSCTSTFALMAWVHSTFKNFE